jgi:hypothetical protein
MKTVARVSVMMLVLMLISPVDAYDEVRPDEVLRVAVDALRIRSAPTTEDSEVLGMLHQSDYVVALEYADEDWVGFLLPDGTEGWACIQQGDEVFLKPLDVDYDTEIYLSLQDWEGNPVVAARLELAGTPIYYTTNDQGDVWFFPVPVGTWDLRCVLGDASAVVIDAVNPERKDEAAYSVDLDGPHTLTVHHAYAESGIAKPNIYIYPVEESEVTVRLTFPAGGGITVSDPPYGDGWTVTVTPEGIIDGEWTFLFYEGRSSGSVQREAGWIVRREDLEGFFRENLAATHFYGPEIEDFVEFWVPRLNDHPFFAVYPQYNPIYEGMVGLAVEPEPWTVIRLAYAVEGLEEYFDLMPAAIPAYEIGGFTVHEWGVILSPGDMDAYLY